MENLIFYSFVSVLIFEIQVYFVFPLLTFHRAFIMFISLLDIPIFLPTHPLLIGLLGQNIHPHMRPVCMKWLNPTDWLFARYEKKKERKQFIKNIIYKFLF